MPAFRVNPLWVDFAHGPGAEDGQPLAVQLTDLPVVAGAMHVSDPVLVAEIISVAELYTFGSTVQEDDRLWFRAYPRNVIRRAKAWLKENPS